MIRVFAEVTSEIQKTNFARIQLLILNAAGEDATHAPKPGLIGKIWRRVTNKRLREGIFWELYERLDLRRKPPCDPLELMDCSELLQGIDRISVWPATKGFVHRFPADAVDQIRSRELDVLIRFGFNIIRGDILTAARYGVWSYHHGDNEFYRGGPPSFWEIRERNPLTGVILQVLTEELDAGLVLCKSLFATAADLWVSQNRFLPYWGSVHFITCKLWELHQYGWESVVAKRVAAAPYQGRRKIYTKPTNAEMIRWLGPRLLMKAVRRPFRRPTLEIWHLAVRTGHPPLYSEPATDLRAFRWIVPPKRRFYADPFLLEHNGRTWVFFEDYDYGIGRAVISCAAIGEDGFLSDPAPCLDRGTHLSFPFVFEHAGEVFMIPESCARSTIDLYRASDFPYTWHLEKTLFRGRYVDTTAFQYDGCWWFFTTACEPSGNANPLLLFSASDLLGEWRYHPANPISSDVRHSRSGGAVLRHGGRLLRTSQNCGPSYGHSIGFHRIKQLNVREYRETLVAQIEPPLPSGHTGIHTYNRAGSIEIIDAKLPTLASQVW